MPQQPREGHSLNCLLRLLPLANLEDSVRARSVSSIWPSKIMFNNFCDFGMSSHGRTLKVMMRGESYDKGDQLAHTH
jgi:hypothetical protein